MKKLNKLFAILVAMAMVLSLTVISAFADVPTGTLANSKLVKELDLAQGVQTPAGTLTFTFAPADVTQVVTNEETGEAETVVKQAKTSGEVTVTKTITYDAGETGTNGKILKNFPLSDLFVLGKAPATPVANTQYLDHAGVYIYEVTESSKVWSDANDTAVSHQDSNAKYRLRIYVVNAAEGETEGVVDGLKVKAVTVEKLLDDNGDAVSGETAVKVDPKTTGTGASEDGNFKFINKYSKQVTGNTEDGALKFTKAVSGELASKTADFDFTLELTLPSTYDTSKGLVFAYTNTNGTNGNATFDATSKKASVSFTLRDDGTLIFATLPAGTTYTVTENLENTSVANASLYTPSAKTYTGSATADETSAQEGKNLEVASYVSDALVGTAPNQAVKNVVDYTNAYDKNGTTTTPEGILISNLPYIALALVAIGGLVAYVVIRRRNADEA